LQGLKLEQGAEPPWLPLILTTDHRSLHQALHRPCITESSDTSSVGYFPFVVICSGCYCQRLYHLSLWQNLGCFICRLPCGLAVKMSVVIIVVGNISCSDLLQQTVAECAECSVARELVVRDRITLVLNRLHVRQHVEFNLTLLVYKVIHAPRLASDCQLVTAAGTSSFPLFRRSYADDHANITTIWRLLLPVCSC